MSSSNLTRKVFLFLVSDFLKTLPEKTRAQEMCWTMIMLHALAHMKHFLFVHLFVECSNSRALWVHTIKTKCNTTTKKNSCVFSLFCTSFKLASSFQYKIIENGNYEHFILATHKPRIVKYISTLTGTHIAHQCPPFCYHFHNHCLPCSCIVRSYSCWFCAVSKCFLSASPHSRHQTSWFLVQEYQTHGKQVSHSDLPWQLCCY